MKNKKTMDCNHNIANETVSDLFSLYSLQISGQRLQNAARNLQSAACRLQSVLQTLQVTEQAGEVKMENGVSPPPM